MCGRVWQWCLKCAGAWRLIYMHDGSARRKSRCPQALASMHTQALLPLPGHYKALNPCRSMHFFGEKNKRFPCDCCRPHTHTHTPPMRLPQCVKGGRHTLPARDTSSSATAKHTRGLPHWHILIGARTSSLTATAGKNRTRACCATATETALELGSAQVRPEASPSIHTYLYR